MVLAGGQTHRSMEQNGEPEIDAHKYVLLVFDKGEQQFNGGKVIFLTNGARAIEHP